MRQLTYSEWHEWRAAGITGSEAPIIMKTSPWCTPVQLFLRRTGRLPPQPRSYPMYRGLKLEPEARTHYEQVMGIKVPPRCLNSQSWPIARASFDGFNTELAHAIEIKCPGREDHLAALSGKIPDKYLFQLVHLAFVADLHAIDYASYNPSFDRQYRMARVVFVRDPKLEKQLLAEERRFWECLQTNTPPEAMLVDRPISSNDRMFNFPVRKSWADPHRQFQFCRTVSTYIEKTRRAEAKHAPLSSFPKQANRTTTPWTIALPPGQRGGY